MGSLRSFTLTILAWCAFGLHAQDGSNDPTFNPDDTGLGLNANARCVVVQPDGKILIGGLFTTCNGVSRNGVARLNADGSLDTGFNPGSGVAWTPSGNYALHEYGVMEMSLQSDGKIVIAGEFDGYNGLARKNIARLNADGSLDTGFDPGTGPSSDIYALAVQSDGHIFIGGTFTAYNGIPQSCIARLNSNGSLDTGSGLGTGAQWTVRCITVGSDDKVMVGGEFSSFNGVLQRGIVRLNTDGSLDDGFGAMPGTNLDVNAVSIQPDGKILIGGNFTQYNGTPRPRLARLNVDGSLDTGFDPGTASSDRIRCIAVKPNGEIYVSGSFYYFNGVQRWNMAKLHTNGSLDTGFDTGQCIRLGFPNHIESIAFTTNDGIIAGGGVENRCGSPYLFKILPNGGLDATFLPSKGANGPIECHAVLANGKIMIGGSFSMYNGVQRNGIARLNDDGTLDTTFDPGTGVLQGEFTGIVNYLVGQPDGKVVITGQMTTVNGVVVNKITRLNEDGSLDIDFNNTVFAWSWGYTDVILQPDGKILTIVVASTNSIVLRFDQNGLDESSYFSSPNFPGGGLCLALQTDGKILIGGNFTLSGTASRIARLNANGSLDPSFISGIGANGAVKDIDIDSAGKILVSGAFTSFNNVPCGRIARLRSDGSLDASFVTGTGFDADVRSSTILPDGKIIASGEFTTFNGTSCRSVSRLQSNGSMDNSFNSGIGANGAIKEVTALPNGKLIISGSFTAYQSYGRNRIARLNATSTTALLRSTLMLEGPYNGTTMTDALRTLPSFPLTEPFTAMGYSRPTYTAGAAIGSAILATTGNNAIVDWVLVEMRPSVSASTVAACRAVLLQRDGDIVDLDGVSDVGFSGLAAGNYSVAVLSRNHLPVMLSPSTPVAFGGAVANVDFTLPGTQVFDNDARINVGGTMTIACGDISSNGTVAYTGIGNDRDLILQRIGGTIATNTIAGYWPEDVNMDGSVRYTGIGNDRDRILVTVGGSVATATRVATLP